MTMPEIILPVPCTSNSRKESGISIGERLATLDNGARA